MSRCKVRGALRQFVDDASNTNHTELTIKHASDTTKDASVTTKHASTPPTH